MWRRHPGLRLGRPPQRVFTAHEACWMGVLRRPSDAGRPFCPFCSGSFPGAEQQARPGRSSHLTGWHYRCINLESTIG